MYVQVTCIYLAKLNPGIHIAFGKLYHRTWFAGWYVFPGTPVDIWVCYNVINTHIMPINSNYHWSPYLRFVRRMHPAIIPLSLPYLQKITIDLQVFMRAFFTHFLPLSRFDWIGGKRKMINAWEVRSMLSRIRRNLWINEMPRLMSILGSNLMHLCFLLTHEFYPN